MIPARSEALPDVRGAVSCHLSSGLRLECRGRGNHTYKYIPNSQAEEDQEQCFRGPGINLVYPPHYITTSLKVGVACLSPKYIKSRIMLIMKDVERKAVWMDPGSKFLVPLCMVKSAISTLGM